jgi:CheY-like chemotaxis protein
MIRLVRRGLSGTVQPELFAALVQACRFCGLLEASVAAHERARALDRHVVTSVCQTYWRLGDEEQALATQQDVLLMDVMLLVEHGDTEEALRRIREREHRKLPDIYRTALAATKAIAEGQREACIDAADWWFANLRDPEALFFMARLVAAVGETQVALTQIERSLDGGYIPYPSLVRDDPWLDSLRPTDQYQMLVERARSQYREALGAFVGAGGPELLGVQVSP